MSTKEISVAKIIALYVVGVGPNGIPNGHLYAERMEDGITLTAHLGIIDELKRQEIVQESHHYLTLAKKGLELYEKFAHLLVLDAEKRKGGVK